MPDGMLAHLRDTYPAPPWRGDGLRQARTGTWDARLAALHARAEASRRRRCLAKLLAVPPAALRQLALAGRAIASTGSATEEASQSGIV